MKTLNFLCIGILAIMYVSCVDYNGKDSHQYSLTMSFVDAEGNDLVNGLKDSQPENSFEASYVLPEQYELTSSPSYSELFPQQTHLYPVLNLLSSHLTVSGHNLLVIEMYSDHDDHLDEITYTLTCPHVFGDDLPHEIVTYWRVSPSSKSNSVCYRMDVDGEEVTDISISQTGSLATIVLDR